MLFALIFAAVSLAHLPLLRLPCFWDEAGYYIPATRDLLWSGSLIPLSTPSNAHPPLVLAYLAVWWKLAGYAPLVTRIAMLAVAAFSLLGIFRLARRVANVEVAVASTVCTAIYPAFFTQSALAHLDLAAAGLTFWGLDSYLEDRLSGAAVWLSLAVLAKETAVLAPLALLGWELLCPFFRQKQGYESRCLFVHRGWQRAALLIPLLSLVIWYLYHYLRKGYVFGNPEFFRYNVEATLNPVRVLLTLGMRLWQVVGYLDLYALTLAALAAFLWLTPLRDESGERPRIAVAIQLIFAAIVASYTLALALVGGAELARYLLPATPLVIVICISTLYRRVRLWRWVIVVVVLAFLAGLFVNPPYGFSLEDNLAYRDYILLHQSAEKFLEARYPMARVLTAWPASDELSRPYLGYVPRPMRVVRIEDFSLDQVMSAADLRATFDVALVFSTKYQPPNPWLQGWKPWDEIRTRYFGFHRDVPPAAAAQILGGELVYQQARRGQWIGIIEMPPVRQAQTLTQP